MPPVEYKFPKDGYQTILLLSLFLYVDNAQGRSLGARVREALGGDRTMTFIAKWIVVIHVLEALAMLLINAKRRASPLVTLKWVATTFFIGFPTVGTYAAVNNGLLP
ncbi:hypothetical protein MSPP1_001711 [Malassezia sp. CBS 17886]|nr:hypothetical protein MSPP1_001711 [Malassezia sp. CBS 17886]